MRVIELTENKAIAEQTKNLGQQSIILTVGQKPVATFLPMAENIAHLAKFAEVIQSEESITLTLNGRPIALVQPLVPFVLIDEDLDLEAVTLSTHPQFLELIEQSRKRHQNEGGISGAEMRQRLGLS